MKSLILFVVAFLFGATAFGQNAFEDAIKLSKFVSNKSDYSILENNKEMYNIMLKYTPTKKKENAVSEAEIKQAFKDSGNPFIGHKDNNSIIRFPNKSLNAGTSLSPNSPNPILNANISKVADGLARFLVERFKEEMNINFIQKFKDYLNEYPEAQVLFPKSYTVLQHIETFQYASILQVLKESFEKDVEMLAIHLADLGNMEKRTCKDCSSNLTGKEQKKCTKEKKACDQINNRIETLTKFFKSEKGIISLAALLSIREVQEGSSPATILNTLATNSQIIASDESNIGPALQLANLFSQNMLNSEGHWPSSSQISTFFNDEYALILFLGLIYQQSGENLSFTFKKTSRKFTVREMFKDAQPSIAATRKFMTTFTGIAANLTTHFKSLEVAIKDKQKLSFYDYHKMLTALGDLVEASLETEQLVRLVDPTITYTTHIQGKLDTFYRPSLDIAYDLAEKNYAAAIYGVTDFLVKLGVEKDDVFLTQFSKYGLFVAEVAKAETSREVQAAIEAIALPVGSARVKRETKTNVAIQAYLGGFFGYEYIPQLEDENMSLVNMDAEKEAFIAAIHAPVGIAFSHGTSNGNSWSIFISAIDIGAVTAYRFKDDDTEVLPEFTLQNILAPGAYLVWGIRNSPISIGLGGQFGPAVRKLSNTPNGVDIKLDNKANYRLGISVAADIPLFNLSTKPRIVNRAKK